MHVNYPGNWWQSTLFSADGVYTFSRCYWIVDQKEPSKCQTPAGLCCKSFCQMIGKAQIIESFSLEKTSKII